MSKFIAFVLLVFVAGLMSVGCATYTTPGAPADFRALGVTPEEARSLSDASIIEVMDRKPVASFPAALAVVRLQGRAYSSYSVHNAYGVGEYTVVTLRDVEKDTDFERLTELPQLHGIAPLNRLVITEKITNLKDLRLAAANVHADILLIYTFDTKFGSERVLPALETFSLGVFPAREAQVTTTASAAFIDTRTGFIYGLAEATEASDRLTNAWNSRQAVEKTRNAAEREAWESLVAQLEDTWTAIVEAYGPSEEELAFVAP